MNADAIPQPTAGLLPTVILTRADDENSRIAPLFRAHGFPVRSVPMIELRRLPAIDRRHIPYDLPYSTLLTSEFATRCWLELLADLPKQPLSYYIVGARSARLLQATHPETPIAVLVDSGRELLQANLEGTQRMVYPCSVERRDETVRGLRRQGIEVMELPLYAPFLPAHAHESLLSALTESSSWVIAFFSPSAVRNFFSLRGDIPANTIFAAIGETTAQALREHGIDAPVVALRPDAEALAEAVRTTAGA